MNRLTITIANSIYNIVEAIMTQFAFVLMVCLRKLKSVLGRGLDLAIMCVDRIQQNNILNRVFEYIAITMGAVVAALIVLITLFISLSFFVLMVLPVNIRDQIGKLFTDANHNPDWVVD